ncbi:DNA-binding transcription repressor [Candidozyma auris]|uniref:GATA-type domain-containing protein n=2 Tax=Candidozyma auris TaxID=498019 RepID=A0A2H0ZMZ8_CANAR|nr:hypothetical protein B9J08_003579 [[Candida] auris]PIS53954.1 hypothetical protein CJI97_003652 [[Candida] auris]
MSLVHSSMFGHHINSVASPKRQPSPYNNMLHSFKVRSFTPPGLSSQYVKKRSYSDLVNESEPQHVSSKRSRTAPPSPPSAPATAVLPPATLQPIAPKKIEEPVSVSAPAPVPQQTLSQQTLPESKSTLSQNQVRLPSLSTALGRRPIVPTVSLDYFDTYKPNDENWRYGLLDSIRSSKPSFSLNSYSYLEAHAHNANAASTNAPAASANTNSNTAAAAVAPPSSAPVKLPPISELSSGVVKPQFDSRISAKALPTLAERKINFPYESNYTYLNKTYMNDVERYPEYLELAQSLIQLSRPHAGAGAGPRPQSDPQHLHHQSHQQMYLTSPSASRYVPINPAPFTPDTSFTEKQPGAEPTSPKKKNKTKFIPITPPSVKDKTRAELMRSPPHHHHQVRVCISCGSDQSPCWRPSWSVKEGQLCNSCGLRYKKTAARCLNRKCKKIPAKGEWSLMQSKGKTDFGDGDIAYSCLDCGWKVEVKNQG